MKRLDSYISDNEQEGQGPSTLFISLYLVILAFFILLNSISQKDRKRTENAMTSLSQVFSSETGMSDLKMNTPAIFDFEFIINDYFNRIDSLIKSSFQLFKVDIKRSGNKLEAAIPIEAFFAGDVQDIGPSQKKFLDNIASILMREAEGVSVHIGFTVDSYSFLGGINNRTMQIDIPRNIKIMEYLLDKGVPMELITGGIKFNDEQNITFRFTVYEAGNIEK